MGLPSSSLEDRRGDALQDYGTVFFTHGSKMVFGVGAAVYSDTYSAVESLHVPGFANVFQTEVLRILKIFDDWGII